VIKKLRERGGHSPRWAAEPEMMMMMMMMMMMIIIIIIIPGDRNVIQKEAEKVFKYKDLTVEIQRM
jgi:hypothetical protein